MADGLPGLLGAMAITIGLLLLALRLLQRLDRRGVTRGKIPMAVVQRMPLGPKQGLALVRLGRRVLLVGTSEQGPTLLTELRGEDRVAALGDQAVPAAEPAPIPAGKDLELKRLLSRLTLGLLTVLTLGGSSLAAQDAGRPLPVTPPTSVAPRPAAPAARVPDNLKVKPPEAPAIDVKIGQGSEQLRLSGTVGLVVFLGALTLLPALVLLMTGFTRILVVLHFLRSALGTQGSPPGQLMVAIAVLLTGVVMQPVLTEANQAAIQPYLEGRIDQNEAYQLAAVPFRRFMLANVREKDLAAFTEMTGATEAQTEDDIPLMTIVSAFVTSELQTAFWMGFVLFIPFVVVDLVVATSLMSLGMFMVPPVMISLPFKLLLFVLADGWSLVGQNLVASFNR